RHEPPGRAGLPARGARRPDPRPLRAAVVDLAQPGHAPRRPGRRRRGGRLPRLRAGAQAPRLRPRRARLRARLPPPPGGAVADAERVPPGCARLPAPALRLPLPRRRPASTVRGLRAPRGGDEGGDRARRRRLRGVVRACPPPPGDRHGDRGGGCALVRPRRRGRRPALQPRRGLEPLLPLPRGRRPAGRLSGRSRKRALAIAVLALGVALVENVRLGAMFRAPAIVSRHDRIAAHALRLVPGDAVVSATNTLGAHLSARRRILSFPRLDDATWLAVDATKPSYGDRSSGGQRAVSALTRMRRNPKWRVVYARDGVLIFRRR